MSIYLGNNEIGQIYLGNTEISEAHLGAIKVFGSSPTPPTPYDSKIEYLESNGTQYIDLGMPIQHTDEMYIDAQATANASGGVYGAYQSSPFCYANITNSGIWLYARYFTASFAVGKVRYEINNDATNLYYKPKGSATSLSKSISNTNTMNVNFYLFAFNNNGTASCGAVKIYSFIVTRNGELLLDMIPVRVGQVGYMYDKVSGQLFGNSGTGNFIIGNDII